MKEQLTLEMLCSYLPYGLKVSYNDSIYPLVVRNNTVSLRGGMNIEDVLEYKAKPIFRNLQTDLTDEMIGELEGCHNFSSMRYSDIYTDPTRYPYTIVQKLLSWHFWIYDQSYFEKGIILDINELNK